MREGETSSGYVDVPTDLQVALTEDASAMSAWRSLTPEARREHVADLDSAGNAAARARCLEGLIHDLALQVPGNIRR